MEAASMTNFQQWVSFPLIPDSSRWPVHGAEESSPATLKIWLGKSCCWSWLIIPPHTVLFIYFKQAASSKVRKQKIPHSFVHCEEFKSRYWTKMCENTPSMILPYNFCFKYFFSLLIIYVPWERQNITPKKEEKKINSIALTFLPVFFVC